MFEDGQDPWSKIQELEALVYHHHREIRKLEQSLIQMAQAFNSQSELIQQVTRQNTELLRDMAVLRGFSPGVNK